jgi:hypothetical protein
VCGSSDRPTRARLSFTLDPWGRVNDTIAREPYTRRYNARWGRFAVNLVGTGVRDCAAAPDPNTCYSEPFLRFHLAHVGPSWVNDGDGGWRTLTLPSGRIEGAKALAAEQWLESVSNGWGKPYVEAVARTELTERPFGGGYVLELAVGPEVRLERIERIQVLIQADYWVKQE